MNRPTKTFLIQFRDLCRAHGVDFSADLNGVYFNSTDESLGDLQGLIQGVEANLEDLEDLEAQLAQD